MELFFAQSFDTSTGEIIISPDEQTHIQRSLRKKEGDTLFFTDGRGHKIRANISLAGKRRIEFDQVVFEQIAPEKRPEIEVGLAVIRPARMDWAIEKLTELGVQKITPLLCQFNSVKSVKFNHLQRITISAIKQSNRYYLPEISPVSKLTEWVSTRASSTQKLIAHFSENSNNISPNFPGETDKIKIAIGPEGGFHAEEVDFCLQHGFEPVSLCSAILRAETAAISAVAQINLFI